MDDFEARQQRLDRARWLVRAELAIAIGLPLVAWFLFIAAAQSIGPMFERATYVESILPWFGSAVYLVGFVWMIRLSRANPEDGESAWRYRDF